MHLVAIWLDHIRNYTEAKFRFSPYTTCIIGPNTSGKTNILESIYAIATGKSFRAEYDREMIRWGSDIGRIRAKTDEAECEIMLTGGLVNGAKAPLKKYTVNKVPRRMIDFVGNLKAVLFWPEHLELVTDSPGTRRRYLDSVLVQVDREYRRNLQSYERGLRQRNRLLDQVNEGTAGKNQLLFWNQLLIKAGSYLTDTRAKFLDFANSYREEISLYHVLYDKSVISEARLAEYADAEIAAKATLVGPHRDDFVFFMSKGDKLPESITPEGGDIRGLLDLEKYGSRGEQRLAILWLKLAEVSFIHTISGQRPMLLLDDIFSELDTRHRQLVFSLIGKQQTVMTSADEDIIRLMPQELKESTVIRLNVA